MDRIDGLQGASVAPPGWSAPTTAIVTPVRAALVAPAQTPVGDAEAAVRWRISAAILDNFLVYGGYLLLCGALHWRVAGSHLWVFAVALTGYHFVFEARDGRRPASVATGFAWSPPTEVAPACARRRCARFCE